MVYAKLLVYCAGYVYSPTHVSFDRLIFAAPPHFRSNVLEVAVVIEGMDRRWTTRALPHTPDATTIELADTLPILSLAGWNTHKSTPGQ